VKAHPLFCDDEDDVERASRDVGFINIYRFNGSKKIALPNQWDPEQLQTVDDIYQAIGAGDFELVGRDARTKQILMRQRVSIEAPKGAEPETPAPQAAPAPQAIPPAMAAGMMQLGAIQIPSGVDPHVAMMMFTAQLNQIEKEQSRADARAHEGSLVAMFTAFTNSQTAMVTGLVGALAGKANAPTGENTTEAILRGIELANDLRAGMKEGCDENAKPESWAKTIQAAAEGLGVLRDVAKAVGSSPATAAGGVVVPPEATP
jgi:hypothetical protein